MNFPFDIKEIENMWIPMSDGVKLAARIWIPLSAELNPVPALLEYIPYRKRDGTIIRDALTHPYLAGHGYACLRVDMRGNGDSEGVMHDEYAPQEQQDALEIIAWIAKQVWCSGKIGMFGISWGGFNSLQVAALRPPALKAIITLCSTDDRYEDDIHYKGGCLINENHGWAATMLSYSSRPPDPAIVGEKWSKMWLERLQMEPFLLINWLQHPYRDNYWKHGSVCEDWKAITVPTLVIGGWNDAYVNAVLRLMNGLQGHRKAIIGPWAHKYPHFASPGPRIGFLQEMLRWWDHWLKGATLPMNAIADYRYYIMESFKPNTCNKFLKGRWVSDTLQDFNNMPIHQLYLNADGMNNRKMDTKTLKISSKQTTGIDGGEYCIIWLGPEFPGDQARDDEQSLTFESLPLKEDLDVVGQPAIKLHFSVDKPIGNIAVRLNDVWPTGEVTRMTYQIQNLCMRDGYESAVPLVPGEHYCLTIKMNATAYRIKKGHRLRVAISTAYFPLMWPAPEPIELSVFTGESCLFLPARQKKVNEQPLLWQPTESASSAKIKILKKGWNKREGTINRDTGEAKIMIVDDFGTIKIKPHDLITMSVGRENYSIMPNDPLSAHMTTHWTQELKRDNWHIRTETFGTLTATKTHWIVLGSVEGYENDRLVFKKTYDEKIERTPHPHRPF